MWVLGAVTGRPPQSAGRSAPAASRSGRPWCSGALRRSATRSAALRAALDRCGREGGWRTPPAPLGTWGEGGRWPSRRLPLGGRFLGPRRSPVLASEVPVKSRQLGRLRRPVVAVEGADQAVMGGAAVSGLEPPAPLDGVAHHLDRQLVE